MGFIGGSMGDDAVIVRGAGSVEPGSTEDIIVRETQMASLNSTVHGAGRVMSRTEAAGKRDRKTGQLKRNKETGEIINAGKVSPEMMKKWIDERGVILKGGGLDESPHAYRRLPSVLADQGGIIDVLHRLRPVIVAMAGPETYDPWKD